MILCLSIIKKTFVYFIIDQIKWTEESIVIIVSDGVVGVRRMIESCNEEISNTLIHWFDLDMNGCCQVVRLIDRDRLEMKEMMMRSEIE